MNRHRPQGTPPTEADVEYVRACLRRERAEPRETRDRVRAAEVYASGLRMRIAELESAVRVLSGMTADQPASRWARLRSRLPWA
ncbi:MAG: hypothetical protein ACK52I_22795 [Pseudomonadota bacterium]